MNNKFRVVFYLRSNYKTKDGKKPIEIRLYHRSERIALGASGFFADAEKWDSKRGRIIGRTSEVAKINNHLEHIEIDLMHIFRRLEFSDNLSLDLIKSTYLRKKDETTSFVAFFDEFIEKAKSEVGKERSYASYQKFNVLRNHFVSFLQSRYHRKDIDLDELSYPIIKELENYLLTDGKCCHNTVMRMMGFFKTITLRAQRLGKLDHDPFVDFKIRFQKTDRGFLTEEEIQTIIAKKFPTPRLEAVRDIFIFSCFTGLAYIDVAHLTADNIVELNGKRWIMTKRQKTNVPTNVLLLDVPAAIITKYQRVDKKGRLLPILSNQKMNSYLKEIADVCKINKNLTFHLARHTFATLSLSMGVPIESVSKMLGHTNIQTTQIYARVTNKKVEQDMTALAGKLGEFSAPI